MICNKCGDIFFVKNFFKKDITQHLFSIHAQMSVHIRLPKGKITNFVQNNHHIAHISKGTK